MKKDKTTQLSGLSDFELRLDKLADEIKSTKSSLECIGLLRSSFGRFHKSKMAEITDKHEIKHGIPFKCPECGEEIQYGLSSEGLKLFVNSRLFKDQNSSNE